MALLLLVGRRENCWLLVFLDGIHKYQVSDKYWNHLKCYGRGLCREQQAVKMKAHMGLGLGQEVLDHGEMLK